MPVFLRCMSISMVGCVARSEGRRRMRSSVDGGSNKSRIWTGLWIDIYVATSSWGWGQERDVAAVAWSKSTWNGLS